MKLDVSVNEVTLTNVGATGEFRIKNSAKAFKILSDGLYSNKIRAIIRELSCNAVDSHVGAGKADVPFEVHLPTILEPWFSVRDFGTGLDGDQVVNVYTTYFESTKTGSNDYIGALGLGSKSPFSYTENFTVTAVKDKIKRIYSAYINDMGIPCVAEMQTEPTEEENGVEVKFSVVDRYDYQSFKHEAHHVFRWFKLQPIITGISDFVHAENRYKEKDIVPGVHLWADNSAGHGTVAVMGNISYPLNKISQPEKYFGGLASLLNCGLVIDFPIGALDFAASREELSYVPLTMKSIKDKLEALNAQLATHIKVKADALTCEWARAEYLKTEAKIPLFKEAVHKYVRDSKFELFDPTDHYGNKKIFHYKVKDLDIQGLEVRGMRVHGVNCSKTGHSREYDRLTQLYDDYVDIPVEMDVVIVLNDIKTGIYSRARYHFVNKPKPGNKYSLQVFCLSHADKDPAERQKHYDKFLKGLHNPPLVFKASELEKKPVVKNIAAIGTHGFMMLKKNSGYSRRQRPDYSWVAVDAEPDATKKHYFIALENYTARRKDGTEFSMIGLKTMIDQSGIAAIKDIPVIGVRKSRIKEVSKLKNWVWFEDKLAEEMNKITEADVEAIVAAEMLDNYNTKVYTNWDAAKMSGPDSSYAKYLEKYAKHKRTGDVSVTNLVGLCADYGRTVVVDTVKQAINKERTELYVKYPLLKYMANIQVSAPDMAHYIMLVDNQEKINE